MLQATQQVRPLNPSCPVEHGQRARWDLGASQSYFPPLTPVSPANAGPKASCYVGFFQGTRLKLLLLEASPSDEQHFKDLRVVAGLFAPAGRATKLWEPHIRIPGNCSPGLPSPHTLLSELSVCGSSLEAWEGCAHTHVLGQCIRDTPACVCALAPLDVGECVLGLLGVCVPVCVAVCPLTQHPSTCVVGTSLDIRACAYISGVGPVRALARAVHPGAHWESLLPLCLYVPVSV